MLLLLFRGRSAPTPPYTFVRSQRTVDVRPENRVRVIGREQRGVTIAPAGRSGTTLLN